MKEFPNKLILGAEEIVNVHSGERFPGEGRLCMWACLYLHISMHVFYKIKKEIHKTLTGFMRRGTTGTFYLLTNFWLFHILDIAHASLYNQKRIFFFFIFKAFAHSGNKRWRVKQRTDKADIRLALFKGGARHHGNHFLLCPEVRLV